METPDRWKIRLILVAAAGCLPLASCSRETKDPAALEAVELLDLLDGKQQRLDPDKYMEVEVGVFKVTHAPEEDAEGLKIKFRLFAIIPESKQVDFAADLLQYDKRIRDAVIAIVQRAEPDQLADPALGWLKSEISIAVNRVLQKRIVRDVAFSSYSIGFQFPKEADPAPAKKESSGGHH